MRKAITIIFLLILILFLGSFIFLKFSVNGAENNDFNTNWRYKFARYQAMREVLGLHYDGDARNDYLGKEKNAINLKVIAMDGLYFNQEILSILAKKIQIITGKQTNITYVLKNIPFSQQSNLKDLSLILQEARDYERGTEQAIVILVIANQNDTVTEKIGSTLQEDGLVLFEGALNKNYSENGNIQAYQQYAVSILMHEFGHQLGLSHNEFPNCLMNKESEIDVREKGGKVVTDFCEQEKQDIKNMKT